MSIKTDDISISDAMDVLQKYLSSQKATVVQTVSELKSAVTLGDYDSLVKAEKSLNSLEEVSRDLGKYKNTLELRIDFIDGVLEDLTELNKTKALLENEIELKTPWRKKLMRCVGGAIGEAEARIIYMAQAGHEYPNCKIRVAIDPSIQNYEVLDQFKVELEKSLGFYADVNYFAMPSSGNPRFDKPNYEGEDIVITDVESNTFANMNSYPELTFIVFDKNNRINYSARNLVKVTGNDIKELSDQKKKNLGM